MNRSRVAVAALLLVAACSGGGEPEPRPNASATTSVRPPASPGADPVIAAAGDIACSPGERAEARRRRITGACGERETARLLSAGRYSAVLALGDNQYEAGSLSDYRAVYAGSWGRFRSSTFPVPGNHDYGTTRAAGYFAYFGSRAGGSARGYYSFDLGSWHLVALNSNCGAIGGCGAGSPQGRWLRRDLAAHRRSCTLAYWHHPRFSSGIHGNDPAYDGFWRLLYAAGADVVLVGHDHLYERFAPQTPAARLDDRRGITEFVVGTGGRSHYPTRAVRANSRTRNTHVFGLLALTLHPKGYDWRFVPAAGGTFSDAGGAACH